MDLLDSGIDRHADRAADILDAVAELQDRDPESPTFGVWPYFYEESVRQMDIPDWNFADFIGKKLVLALKHHRDRLPEAHLHKLIPAVRNACAAIIKRDTGPSYTNIAVMGAFVTLVGGETLGQASIAEYGLNRIKRFHDFTMRLGCFTEYNSPHYAPITLEELHHLNMETENPEAVSLTGELIRFAWQSIAEHYHPRTGQWSGPHSRSYATMLEPGRVEHRFLSEAIGDHAGPDAIRCPDDLLPYFSLAEERQIRQAILDENEAGYQCHASTYICEAFSVGTFSKESMWNQRRNLITYLNNHGKPVYAHLRFLKDGKDFSSAVFTGVQDKSDIVFGINMALDFGDWHPVLDPVNGVFEAEDLRVRIEIGGYIEGVDCSSSYKLDYDAAAVIGDQTMRVKQLSALSDEGVPRIAITPSEQEGTLSIDYIIYEGPRKQFDFHEWNQAAWVYLFTLSERVEELQAGSEYKDGSLYAWCEKQGRRMGITIPVKPDRIGQLFRDNEVSFMTEDV